MITVNWWSDEEIKAWAFRSFKEFDINLVQFYVFFAVWLQQLGV